LILETEKEEAKEKKREEMLSKEKEERAVEQEEGQRSLFGPPGMLGLLSSPIYGFVFRNAFRKYELGCKLVFLLICI
jgi:hypothetical protein